MQHPTLQNKMTRIDLTKPNREKIATDSNLRAKLSADLKTHERTIQRWATSNSPKLVSEAFLMIFKKHTNCVEPLTKEIKIKQLIEH